MPTRKRVDCICHGALAAGPQYQTYWEDVWLRWDAKPGRRRYYAAPMIATRADLEADLQMNRDVQAKHPELDYSGDIRNDEALLRGLDAAPFVRDNWPCPNVYTNAEHIDRAEAERMLTWFLADAHGVHNPKFVWRKAKFIVQSVSFAELLPRRDEA